MEPVEQTPALTGDGAGRSEKTASPLGSIRKVDKSENLLNQKIQNVLCAKTGEGINNPTSWRFVQMFLLQEKV